ncbi:hypothetical protein ERJ75_000689700 [Trypanosoma vivax]|nr:hypothetical protein ERJ75_000689700 [Trypanosoma vivax]
MGSWPFVPACSVRPAIAKARTSRAASARRHVARRCPSANLAHAHHGIPVSPPFPSHKVRWTTGGNASRHGRVTVSAVRACVALCAWPQDRCRAQCDAYSRQSEPSTRVAARTGRPQRPLVRAPAAPAVFRDAVSVCVVRHASLSRESAAASILLAPPSVHLNPTLSLALPWANARATVPSSAAALRSRHATDAVSFPARRCDRVGPRRDACACPSLRASSAAIVGWPADRVAAGSADAREGGLQWSERRARASRQHNACSVCRARRRGGRAMNQATRQRARAGTCDRSCVGARSLRARRGQARPTTVWREGPQDAGLGVRKGAVAAGAKRRRTRSKGRVLEAERWPPEQARRAAAGRTGTAGKKQRRHQEDSQGVGRCRRTAHFEGDWAGSHKKKRWRRAGKRPTNAAPRHCTRRKAGGHAAKRAADTSAGLLG